MRGDWPHAVVHTNDEARRTTCKYRRIIANVTQSTRQRRDDGDEDDNNDDDNDDGALTRSRIHSSEKNCKYIVKRSL